MYRSETTDQYMTKLIRRIINENIADGPTLNQQQLYTRTPKFPALQVVIYIYIFILQFPWTYTLIISKSDDLVTYYIYIQVLSQAKNVLVGIKFTKWHKKLKYLNFVKIFNTFYLKM